MGLIAEVRSSEMDTKSTTLQQNLSFITSDDFGRFDRKPGKQRL